MSVYEEQLEEAERLVRSFRTEVQQLRSQAIARGESASLKEIGRRMGCEGNWVKEILEKENLTLRTVAKILLALGHRLTISVERIEG